MLPAASANPLSVVKWGNYRLTVLTNRCVRIEYNSQLVFEDRPSRTFIQRRLNAPQFTKEMTTDTLVVLTSSLKISFNDPRSPPNSENTLIKLINSNTEWKYSIPSQNSLFFENTLFSVVDDSHSPVVNKDGILVLRTKCETDTYFFCHDKSILDGIEDFYTISGPPELLPRYAFKMIYSAKSIKVATKVYDNYKARNISLGSVFLGDTWHTDTQNFNWKNDVKAALQELYKRNLKVGIQLDFLKGISKRETQYKDFADFLKVSNGQTIEYAMKKSAFVKAFVKFVMDPLIVNDSISFFYINEEILPLNKAFFNRKTDKRSLMITKYRELGSQRYPCSFIPTKCQNWEELSKLPYYISSLSNHGVVFELFEIDEIPANQPDSDELCIRLFQLASLLPIVKMNTSPDFPWNRNTTITCFLLEAIQFHNSLLPYFYSIAYKCYNEKKELISPMHHYYKEDTSSFYCPCQFMIGENLIAAPFVTKIDNETHYSRNAVWFPNKTIWFEFETGREYNAGWHGIHGNLSNRPVFAKAGSIIPTEVDGKLTLHIFPKGSQTFSFFDDDGETKQFKKGKYVVIKIATTWENDNHMMISFERIGNLSFFEKYKHITIRLHNFNYNAKVTGDLNLNIIHERIELGDFTFEAVFSKFPATIRVRTLNEELLCIDKTRITSHDLADVLKAANMTTWVKQSDMNYLQNGNFFSRLTASSHLLHEKVRLLLLEELGDCGFIHFTKDMGKNILIVWNNSNSDIFNYMYKRFEPLKKEEIMESSGPVPSELFFIPEKEITVWHRHLLDLPTAETLLELRICDTLLFSIDFDSMM